MRRGYATSANDRGARELHVLPAVDVQLRAGDPVPLRAEEPHQPRHLVGLAESPQGMRLLTASFAACGMLAIMSVSTNPGQMALTVMPYLASSCATLLVKAMTPAFAAA